MKHRELCRRASRDDVLRGNIDWNGITQHVHRCCSENIHEATSYPGNTTVFKVSTVRKRREPERGHPLSIASGEVN